MHALFRKLRGRLAASAAAIFCLCLALAGCDSKSPSASSSAGAAGKKPGVDVASSSIGADKSKSTPQASVDLNDRLGSISLPRPDTTSKQEPSPFRFDEVAAKSGIAFRHVSGMTKEKNFPTANGSGAAVLDFDGDGKMDIYFATCTMLPLGKARTGPNRLYKNLGNGKYRDATEESGLGFEGFCHGIIVGDVDNDGDQDVFLANYGPNVLFLNDGKGKFTDVSKSAGVDKPNWSSGGAFLDYDNDGDLDLYVSNYGKWNYEEDANGPHSYCGDKSNNIRLYCSPKSITTVRHILYKNKFKETGKVAFEDVTVAAGVGRTDGHGFGVVAADLNDDGLIDLYVANDLNPNFVYLNKGDGTFDDQTEISGAAFDDQGRTQSGMGVEAEDVNGDGRVDLFVTNFQDEYNTLYINMGNGMWSDQTPYYGLAADSLPWVGWGCSMADFDNDGWPDCFVANGHVDDNRRDLIPPQPVDYPEPPLLHRNIGLGKAGQGAGAGAEQTRKFVLSTRDVGPYFASKHVARGVAYGDLDDDGRMDLVINHKDDAPAVLMNRTPGGNKWIRLRLVGTKSNRDAVGAKVEVEIPGRKIYRQRRGGTSMQSAHDPRLLIGIGDAKEASRVTIRWPSKAVTVLEHVEAGKEHEIVEK